jgi:hypothetical protein
MLRRLEQFDAPAICSACEILFAARHEHAWIPQVPEYSAHWKTTMSRLATEIDYPLQDPEALIAEFSKALPERK